MGTLFVTETNKSHLYHLLDFEFAWLEHPSNSPLFGKYSTLTGERKAGFEFQLLRVVDYFLKYNNLDGDPKEIIEEYLNQYVKESKPRPQIPDKVAFTLAQISVERRTPASNYVFSIKPSWKEQ